MQALVGAQWAVEDPSRPSGSSSRFEPVYPERLRRHRVGHQRHDHAVAGVPAQDVVELEAGDVDPAVLEEISLAKSAGQRDRLAPDPVRYLFVALARVVGAALDDGGPARGVARHARCVVEPVAVPGTMMAIPPDAAPVDQHAQTFRSFLRASSRAVRARFRVGRETAAIADAEFAQDLRTRFSSPAPFVLDCFVSSFGSQNCRSSSSAGSGRTIANSPRGRVAAAFCYLDFAFLILVVSQAR